MQTDFETIRKVITQRRTTKILAEDGPVKHDLETLKACEEKLYQCIEAAGLAPFHYDRACEDIAEPWRINLLTSTACQQLATALPELVSLKPSSKVPHLLDACSFLVIVSWIPTSGKSSESLSEKKIQQVNSEHLCAAAAFTQNLLLLAESLRWKSYWGSAGLLQTDCVLDAIGISRDQQITAAVYLQVPPRSGESPENQTELPGKMHKKRSDWKSWTKKVATLNLP